MGTLIWTAGEYFMFVMAFVGVLAVVRAAGILALKSRARRALRRTAADQGRAWPAPNNYTDFTTPAPHELED